jgi:amino acid adenylation domain-containing protein
MRRSPASHLESQFFFSDQLHGKPGLNTVTHAVRIRGTLVLERLETAFTDLKARFSALRSTFASEDGAILRLTDEAAYPVRLAVDDVVDTDAAVFDAAESIRQTISASQAVWSVRLLRHEPQCHTLIVCAHRIVWDELSTAILAADLSEAYAKEPFERKAATAVENAPATDVAAAGRLADGLREMPPLHGFPLKAARPKILPADAASVDSVFDPATAALIAKRAAQWSVSPFLVECAAATYVLAAYGAQKALTVGLPFDLRRMRKAGGEIGSYTAIVPVGVDTAAAPTFEALVRRLAEQVECASHDADTPFRALMSASKVRTDPSANSLFQIAFGDEHALGLELLDLEGCVCEARPVPAPPQQVDLFLQLAPDRIRFAYLTAIVDETMAASFVRSYDTFLGVALAVPSGTLESIPLMDASHRRALLVDLNKTDEPQFLGPDLFATVFAHCRGGNAKCALVAGGKRWTYAELESAVLALAGRLQSQSHESELVGICLPRSADMVVAMLAVVRGGGAYVPLDPAFPAERLRFMVEHSRLGRIVTTTTLQSLFDGTGVDIVALDLPAGTAQPAPVPRVVPSDAKAYVIYTSGSTGKPKGVAVSRGALVNFLLSMIRRPGVTAADTWCAVTTLSFDIAELELLAPLCVGATVVIATEEEAKDPRLLLDLLRDHQASILQATPVTWQMLLGAGFGASKPTLKALCGGEALSPNLAQALAPKVRELWNMYGPTETTVWSTCERIDDANAPITVGSPIHNTSVYVLDDGLRPVPRGVEGRLFIGGAGVALGYLHDDELTAKRFLPDPFVGQGRIYDTGDRARIDAAGLVHVLGRSDFQVKLRGFRIELGEIETRLSSLAGVEQVVCVVRNDDPANPELAAYFTCKPGAAEPSVSALRSHCAGTLPAHMIPSRFRRLDELPRTPNGKLDRKALPRPVEETAAAAEAAPSVARNESERVLAEIWCQVLSLPRAGLHDNFFELGGTSLAAFSIVQLVSARLGVEISVIKIFEHATIATFAQFLQGRKDELGVVRSAYERAKDRRRMATSPTAFDVAVIGVAGRFPGAANVDELWRNLCEGRESVTVFRREDLDPLVPESDRNDPNYIPARGVLAGSDLFDAAFFGITPNEAELMDPQLRVFMEVAWEAFESSGYVGGTIAGDVGVWAGMGNNFYYHHNVLTRPDKLAIMGDIAAEIANEKDHIAPRVSHKLNLKGPSLSVHTACSTTLVVIENAYQALVSNQVDVALAGGVDIRTPQRSGQRFEEGGVFSNDGHCRPFDAAATGTMFGEGAGAVVLKRLDDAIRDGDTIWGVIRGAAVNHDGGHKVSYLAPSVEGQARVIASALGIADIDPGTVSLIEAHGTATPIGDPIEIEALTRVHRCFSQRRRYCAVGSIKGNFGHATTAAGIAGVLKVILSMRHRQIPPTLHFSKPNPRIDFASSPFFVNDKLVDWEPKGVPRRAGVSSFGFCGTNAHIVLEEAPAPLASSAPSRAHQLVLLSARNVDALEEGAKRLSLALAGRSPAELADALFTTHLGRKRFEHRRCAVVENGDEVATILTQASGARSVSAKSDVENPPVLFMFPGQGAQYINMGLRLYQGEPVFKNAVDTCSTALIPHLGCDLRDFLFPSPADNERAAQSLSNTFYTQPAIFTISYSLASLFRHWGISPSAFIGHSIGEFVAATLAGVMELPDALRLVATRGRLMQSLPGGSMLTVRLGHEQLAGRLPAGVDVAAVNGPRLCVVAGPTELVTAFGEKLAAESIATRMLHTSHAFHSTMMDPVVEPFLRTVESVRLSQPRIPFISTVTGDWITGSEVTDPSYWARHLRSTVQFSKAVQVALADANQVLLECGPRRTCASLALQQRPKNPGRVIATMPDSGEPQDEYPSCLLALGSLWLGGCNVDFATFHEGERRCRVPLPSYAFQRKRYWIEPGVAAASSAARGLAPATVHVIEPDASAKPGKGDGDALADSLTSTVVGIVEELLGSKLESFDENAKFIALGLDSLLLTQLARAARVRLGFDVSFRDLTERYSSTKLLVDAIRAKRGNAAPAIDVRTATAPIVVPQAIGAAAKARSTEARLGRDERGRPAWFVPDPDRPGKFVQVAKS